MANDNIGDKINEILNNPDAVSKISQMMSGASQSSVPTDDNLEMTRKISAIASKINDRSDPKINLLYALKPYMNSTRTQHIDKAIKMLRLTQITELFKDL